MPKPEAAAPTTDQAAAEKVVQTQLIAPLASSEGQRSRFSRVQLPPQTRRVRLLDSQPKQDDHGAAFLRFAIDARHGFAFPGGEKDSEQGWRKDTLTGCVYVGSSEVFVRRGDSFLTAAALLGKRSPAPAAHICQLPSDKI
jgi:hypothetical protein